MRTLSSFALATLIAVALTSAIRGEDPAASVPSIIVTGTAKVEGQPDMAQVQVGVTTEGSNAADTLDANNTVMAGLLKKLTAADIAAKDVQTSNLGMTPRYKHGAHGEQLPEIMGYQVTDQVSVKVRNLSSLGRVLDTLVKAGVNQIQGISFSVAQPKSLFHDARQRAFLDARDRAESYAQAAGVKLGPVLRIQEQSSEVPIPVMMRGGVNAEVAGAVPVAPGQETFRASVTVTYGIGGSTASSLSWTPARPSRSTASLAPASPAPSVTPAPPASPALAPVPTTSLPPIPSYGVGGAQRLSSAPPPPPKISEPGELATLRKQASELKKDLDITDKIRNEANTVASLNAEVALARQQVRLDKSTLPPEPVKGPPMVVAHNNTPGTVNVYANGHLMVTVGPGQEKAFTIRGRTDPTELTAYGSGDFNHYGPAYAWHPFERFMWDINP